MFELAFIFEEDVVYKNYERVSREFFEVVYYLFVRLFFYVVVNLFFGCGRICEVGGKSESFILFFDGV